MLRVAGPPENVPQRSYVLDVVLRRWLGLDFSHEPRPGASTTTITCDGHEGSLSITESVLLTDLGRTTDLNAVADDARAAVGALASDDSPLGTTVPVLHGPTPPEAARLDSTSAPSRIEIGIDVFGSAFALLTGLEDRFVPDRDEHGRVPLAATHLGRRGLVDRPVVDELTELIRLAILRLWPHLPFRQRESTISVTQDVDRVTKYGRATPSHLAMAAAAGLRRGGPAEAARCVRGGLAVRARGVEHDPYFTFDRFMDVVEDHGHTASFNFITRYAAADGTTLGHYDVSSSPTIGVVERVLDRGHQVGLHPGYDSHLDVDALKADASALRSAARAVGKSLPELGGRHHYLRWDSYRSPACWQGAGLVHDSSVGFAECAGFRAGTSKPFPLWDHQRNEPTDVEERPLIFMDASLPAMGLSAADDETVEHILALRRRCEQYHGDFTVLIHNDEFARPGVEALLRAILS